MQLQLLLPPFDLPNPSIRLLAILIRIHFPVCIFVCLLVSLWISWMPWSASAPLLTLSLMPQSSCISSPYRYYPQLLDLFFHVPRCLTVESQRGKERKAATPRDAEKEFSCNLLSGIGIKSLLLGKGMPGDGNEIFRICWEFSSFPCLVFSRPCLLLIPVHSSFTFLLLHILQ